MKPDENEKETRQELINSAASAYMELFAMMQSAAVSHWLMFELTFAQARALIILAAKKALTVSQLAKLMDVGNPTASILVQKLVERGLVTRTEDDTDRRQTVVRLSEQGAEIGAGRRSEREKQWQSWLSNLSDEDLSGLAHGLTALLVIIDADAQPAPENVPAVDKTQ
jgi:DNA-binding MarR family transcriptional regulator